MLIDSAIYFVIGWYFRNVIPGQFFHLLHRYPKMQFFLEFLVGSRQQWHESNLPGNFMLILHCENIVVITYYSQFVKLLYDVSKSFQDLGDTLKYSLGSCVALIAWLERLKDMSATKKCICSKRNIVPASRKGSLISQMMLYCKIYSCYHWLVTGKFGFSQPLYFPFTLSYWGYGCGCGGDRKGRKYHHKGKHAHKNGKSNRNLKCKHKHIKSLEGLPVN